MEAGFLEPAGLDLAAGDLLGSTTHISVLDGDGMCASVTCSNGSGSGVLVPGTGVILNNMLGEEDLNPLGFHRIPPGRRVPSMMAPTVVLRDGEIVLGARQRRLQPDPLGDPADRGPRGRAGAAGDGGGRGAAPAFRGGRRPGRAGDRRGGAGAAGGARPRGRPPAGDQPLLRRRPGGRPRSATAAPSAAAATRAAAAPSPTPSLGAEFRVSPMRSDDDEGRSRSFDESGRARTESKNAAMATAPEIDFEAEGLLDELDGEAREARLTLLRGAGGRRRAAGGAARRGQRRAAGAAAGRARPGRRRSPLHGRARSPRSPASTSSSCAASAPPSASPTPTPTSRAATEADLEAARRMKAFRDAGLPEEGMLQVARTIGMGTARIAEANRELVINTLAQPGDSERDLALRFAAAAEFMMPLVGPDHRPRPAGEHARADPPRRDRHRRPRLRRRSAAPPTSPSASPTWSSSPASARRSRPRSWAWSPAAWRRWPAPSPSRRCGW